MFKRMFVLALCSLSFGVMAISPVMAQEVEEQWEFTFGKVASVSNDQITISEYNLESEQEADVTYAVNATTEFVNIEGLSALKPGDDIEIEFKEEEGQKVAMAVAKDEEVMMEENMGEAMEEPAEGNAVEENAAEEVPAEEMKEDAGDQTNG
ncbi:MAG TPA: DUF5666 domain-containing protein [Candidatus Omnitrophota bacterium]|nr:DUF5666 domain-containing protein [Candidatus Omnitrophota bacterium]